MNKTNWTDFITTNSTQYIPLDVTQELKNVRSALKTLGAARKRSFITDFNEVYRWDMAHYKRLLNAFKQTKVKNTHWRFCGLRGVIEIVHSSGRYVLKLQ